MSPNLQLALLSCTLLGFRHGFDYDHLAAITDIASVQRNFREGLRLGLLYALGHAATVVALGIVAITFRPALPQHMDAIGERMVGATLIAMGIYIVVDLLRRPPDGVDAHRTRSRIALLISSLQYLHWRFRKLHNPQLQRPAEFRFTYATGSVWLVGMLHGLGAETPSQLVLFLLAANLGGTGLGLLGLACFISGLLCMNTLMTLSASGVFAGSRRMPRLQNLATGVSAAYSFALGAVFLFGISDRLPH